MNIDCSAISCGVVEGSGIGYPGEAEKDILDAYQAQPFAFIVFSDVVRVKKRKSPGQKLATHLQERIKKHNIGVLTASPARKNPNSGNKIRVWCLAINPAKVDAWYNLVNKGKEIIY